MMTNNILFLKALLGNLTERCRSSLNYTVAKVGKDPADEVYGDVLCRGDVNVTVCANCVRLSAKEVTKRCSFSPIATVWYDHCRHRYSFQTIPGDDAYSGHCVNDTSATDATSAEFEGFFSSLSREAVKDESEYFKTGELKYSRGIALYALVQCIPTDAGKCLDCLNGAGTLAVVSNRCTVMFKRDVKERRRLELVKVLTPPDETLRNRMAL